MAFASGLFIKNLEETWTCPTMNKTLQLCLLAILLFGVVARVIFLSSGARAQGDGIIVDGADYRSDITNEQSAELGDAATEVTSRVVAEYGDFGSKLELDRSNELDQVTSAVSSRATVEYADYTLNYASQTSDALQQAAATVTSRIIVEYADYVISLAQLPYLGPQQYQDDTVVPNIVVTREPSGPQVNESIPVIVSANVTDVGSGVRNATLQYTLDNSTNWSSASVLPMSLNLTVQPQNCLALSFNATIPGQPSGTHVHFRIIAYDFAGNNATRDDVYPVVPEFSAFMVVSFFMVATLLATLVLRLSFRHKHAR
jgi:hypothetical protein